MQGNGQKQVAVSQEVQAQAVDPDFKRLVERPVSVPSIFEDIALFEKAQRVATLLASSSMVPRPYQIAFETVKGGAVANCMIALELSTRIRASVFMVMQNLDVVYGRPSWRATFLIATVNSSGRFDPLQWDWRGKPGEPEYGARAFAKDLASGKVLYGSWIDMKLVKAEGWWDRRAKDGGPSSKWPTMTEQMFMYRSASWWTRTYCPELSMGMHTSDEVLDSPREENLFYSANLDMTPAQATAQAMQAVEQDIQKQADAKKAEGKPKADKPKPPKEAPKTAPKDKPVDADKESKAHAQDVAHVETTGSVQLAPEDLISGPPVKQPAMFPESELDGPEWMTKLRNCTSLPELEDAAADVISVDGIDAKTIRPVYDAMVEKLSASDE